MLRPAALAKVIINLVEWPAHHLDPSNILETPSKLALKWNIFPYITGVFITSWNKSALGLGSGMWDLGRDSDMEEID